MQRFLQNPHFRSYEELLIRLHQLFREGLEDSRQAEDVRERMDVHGGYLSPEEADWLGGLSGDLYQLDGEEIFVEVHHQSEADALKHELERAIEARDWNAALQVLRRRPVHAPDTIVAMVRGLAYSELGHWSVALEFVEFGLSREPENFHFRYQLLAALATVGRVWEGINRARAFEASGPNDLYWLVQYVALLERHDFGSSEAMRRLCYEHAVEQLQHVLSLPDCTRDNEPRVLVYAYASLALSHEDRGRLHQALSTYQRAVGIAGSDPELLEFLDMVGTQLTLVRRLPSERAAPALRISPEDVEERLSPLILEQLSQVDEIYAGAGA
jgi:tetratricopeptide (TPR) repeat protein